MTNIRRKLEVATSLIVLSWIGWLAYHGLNPVGHSAFNIFGGICFGIMMVTIVMGIVERRRQRRS